MNSEEFARGLNDPSSPIFRMSQAISAASITPTDGAQLTGIRGLWVGTGGDVAMTLGEVVVIKNVPDGTLLPFSPTTVEATGTNAQDIVGLS